MIGKISLSVACLLALVALTARNGGPRCDVRITEPRSGQGVGARIAVGGTAVLPAGHHVWIFARKSDFAPRWWPQGEAQFDENTGKWQGYASIGKVVDVGSAFDLNAVVFAAEQHVRLNDLFTKMIEDGRFFPIEPPKGTCAAKPLRIKKTSRK